MSVGMTHAGGMHEMKLDKTAAAPAPACVANSNPTFPVLFCGLFGVSENIKIFYFEKKV
jgi:hypothetical protein